MPALPVRLLLTALLASWFGATASAVPWQQDTEDSGTGGQGQPPPEEEYVELFDPEREDPQDPVETALPELPFDGLAEEETDGPAEAQPQRPWDEEERGPDRILTPDDARDPRSVELFSYECADELQRRGVTLFANGTLRMRRGPIDDQEMQLDEIGPDELRRRVDWLLRVRASPDFPSQLQLRGSLQGRWIDTCRFALDLPGWEPVMLDVGAFDALPLPLRQLQQYADELAGLTRPLVAPESLGPGYEPRVGEALRTGAGEVFRIIGFTSDRRAVELERLDGERRVFVAVEELPDYFVALEPGLGEGR